MAQDEGRFGRVNIPVRCWSKSKMRPKVPKQTVREYFYSFAAICPKLGTAVSLILPNSNTEMMNIFLEEVSKNYLDYFVIMQVDQAGWHKSKDLKIPKNIAFIYQPAYSPELNPTEQFWKEIRKNIGNKIFSCINNAIDAVSESIRKILSFPDKVKSMTLFPHFNIAV